jgi:hypothetical protein
MQAIVNTMVRCVAFLLSVQNTHVEVLAKRLAMLTGFSWLSSVPPGRTTISSDILQNALLTKYTEDSCLLGYDSVTG